MKQVYIVGWIIAFLLLTGTLAYHALEGWSYFDSLYFTTMTVTTIRYGDFLPSTPASKAFTIVFALAGVSVILYALNVLGREYYEKQSRTFEKIHRKVRRIRKARKVLGEERRRNRDYRNPRYGY